MAAHGHFAEAARGHTPAIAVSALPQTNRVQWTKLRPNSFGTEPARQAAAAIASGSARNARGPDGQNWSCRAHRRRRAAGHRTPARRRRPSAAPGVEGRRDGRDADCTSGRPARGTVSLAVDNPVGRRPAPSTRPTSRSSEVDTVAGKDNPQRALLWVDAVGGFLVCLDDCIAIGQPSPGESSPCRSWPICRAATP